MRFFHNKVKHSLIEYASNHDNSSLLDVGMGRGGDLLKWRKCNIRKVVGYDPNKISVDDAHKRLLNLPTNNLDYSFYCCLDMNELDLSKKSFSIVSCQFAIHYFFSDITTVRHLLLDIKRNLKRNGFFIGTFMNADKVNEFLIDNTFMNNAIMIKKFNTTLDRLGETIHVHLAGTLYFSEDCVSIEYMVYPDILITECENVGLKLVSITPFEKHFSESNYNITLDESHRQCSFMYSSFVFQLIK